jgi:hypothetical protein
MSGYRFARGISACRPADRLILLDLENDRYFALVGARDAALSRLMAGTADDDDWPVIEAMAEHGLLEAVTSVEVPRLCPALPASLSPTPAISHEPSLWGIASAAAAVLCARHAIKRRGLAATIADLRRQRETMRPSKGDAPDRIAASFGDANRLVSALDQCLPRSMAMGRRLFRAGLPADLIIGVAVQPFRAHCWVQFEGRLLVDEPDTVRLFTPILML